LVECNIFEAMTLYKTVTLMSVG